MPSNTTSKEKFDIIMFNMSSFYDWDRGVINRNFNVLSNLAKDDRINKIVSCDFLPVGIRKAVAHYVRNVLIEPKTAEMVYGDLTSVCYQKTDKIYVYSTIDSLFSLKIVARELRRIEKILGLKNIIFWSFNPIFVEFIGRLNEKLFVFDTVDNWSEHKSYVKLAGKGKLLKNYQTIAQKADIIFTVADELSEFYKEQGRDKNVFWIPNGVDYEHFTNSRLLARENSLSTIKEKIIGYLGTIEDRFDLDIIAALARKYANYKIALCGPIWPSFKSEFEKKLGSFRNIITTGRVSYDDAPNYINRFDVAIIPHKVNAFIKSTNPMKMFDYLACGKAIVTTRGSGVDMFKDYLYIADSTDQFVKEVQEALDNDSMQKQQARKTIVQKHTWANRVNAMLEIVFSKIK